MNFTFYDLCLGKFSLYLYSRMYKQSLKIFLAKFSTKSLQSSSPSNVSSGIYILICPFVPSTVVPARRAEKRMEDIRGDAACR